MNESFLIQAGLWGTATTLSALATTQYFNFKRKERNLPAACELEALETELALKRTQLRDANETIGRAQIALAHADETRKWISSQQAELARIQEMGGAVAAIDYMKETLIAANAARVEAIEKTHSAQA